jgi:hypothetical protein
MRTNVDADQALSAISKVSFHLPLHSRDISLLKKPSKQFSVLHSFVEEMHHRFPTHSTARTAASDPAD